MKKIILTLTITLLASIFLFVSFKENKVEAATPTYELYFEEMVTGQSNFSSRSDLEANLNDGMLILTLNARSLTGSDVNLSALELNFNASGPIGGIQAVQSSVYKTDMFGNSVYNWDITMDESMLSMYVLPNEIDNVAISPSGTYIAMLALAYDQTNTEEIFSYDMVYSDSAYTDGDVIQMAESDFTLQSFQVGDPTAEPSAEITNLEVSGQSGTTYYNSSILPDPDSANITITYQDSLNQLMINPTLASPTATVSYSGKSLSYVDGDVITLTVSDTDGTTTVTENYMINVNVTPPKAENILNGLTINKGHISPAFSSDITSYTVNLDYSETDLLLTASVNPDDLSTLNKTEYDETFPVGTTTREFIVTAEDGTTKTYTINVVRSAASTDSSISELYVDGQLQVSDDGTSYLHTLDELDSNFNFKVITSNEYAEIEYKLSSDTSYSSLINNTNSPNFPIDNNQTLTYDIKVTAQDGSSTIYNLEVARSASTETALTKVEIEEGLSKKTLSPQNGIYEYILTNSGESLISVNTEISDYASVKILDPLGNEVINGEIAIDSLSEDTHQFQIVVTAQDGSTEEVYQLNVVKKSSAKDIVEIIVKDSDYNVIELPEGDETFNSSTNTYLFIFDYSYNNVRFEIESSPLSKITTVSSSFVSTSDNFGYVDVTLSSTSTSITFNVEAEDGTTKQYTLTFRERPADSTNTLDDLQVDGMTINGFNSTKFSDYDRIILPGNTTSVYVEGIINADVNSTITYNGLDSKQISLVRGEVKTVNIKVTAEDGSFNTYTIEIVAANENNEIENIIFSNINFTFNAEVTEYNYSVDYIYNSTNISVITPTGANSVVFGDGSKVLEEGLNTFKVYVESEAGIQGTEYTFNITRKAARSDKQLISLSVGTASLVPEFLSGIYSYDVRVDESVTEVLISATVPDNGSSIISGTGTVSLQSGKTKTVDIVVQAEDGTKQSYTVNILRANDINTFDKVTIDGIDYLPSDFNASNELILPEQPFSNKEIVVSVQKTDSFSTTTIMPSLNLDNEWLLNEGLNTLTFYVTSQAGTKGQTYKIITNQTSPKTNNDLHSLEVLLNGEDLLIGDNEFAFDKYNYSLRVDNDVNDIRINATVNTDDRSSISGDTGNITLSFVTMIYTVTVTAEDGSEQDYNIEVIRQNNNNNITDIEFSGYEDVIYDPVSYTYDLGNVAYSVSSLDLSVLLEDASADIYVNNKLVSQSSTVNLIEGLNTIEIYAQSEYGTKGNVYTYTIERNVAQSKADLSDLQVLADGTDLLVGDLIFNPETLIYELRVDRSVSSVSINASVNLDDQSTLSGDTGNNPLSAGLNAFRVTVTAEDGTTKNTYLIEVTRANDNHQITDITVDGHSIGFDPLTNTYTLDPVDFTVNDIDIQVSLEDSYATVNLQGVQSLVDGQNTFNITATSEYGSVGETYTISIYKEAANKGNLLESLELLVDGVNVLVDDQAFIATKNNYEIRIDNHISEVLLSASAPEGDRSTISGAGLKTLSSSSEVLSVKVTAENGDENIYNITIIRKNDNNNITDIEFSGYEDVIYDPVSYTYDLGNVAYSVSSLDLSVLLEDASADIYVNNKLVSQSSTVNLIEGLNTIEIYAQSEYGTKGNVYTYTIERNIAQSKANLSDLQVLADGNNLLVGDLIFNPETLIYELRVDRSVSSVSINASVNLDDQSTLSGDTGNNPLSAGLNAFRVTVTAEDGMTKNTYLIEVTRANDNHQITDITVDGQSIGFDPSVTEYTLDPVTYDVTSLDIASILEDTYASINFEGAYTLSEGMNTIEIFATSEFGTKGSVYRVLVEKYSANSNNLLDHLQVLVNGVDQLTGSQSFDPLTNIYHLRVDNDITQIEILADVLESDRSTLSTSQLGLKNLIAGTNNAFKVTVTAEDGSENHYEINISSENNNYNISDIFIDQVNTVTFDPNVYTYDLGNLSYSQKSIDFSVLLEDPSATLRINGKTVENTSNHILNTGLNTFVIQVESEYGEFGPEYVYTVTQEEAMSNADLLDLQVLLDGQNLLIDDLAFDPTQLIYELRVNRDVESVDILAFLDSQYHSSLSGETGSKPLDIGKNTFDIHVTAEDKTTSKTYRLVIYKNNDDAGITDIQIDGVTLPGFDQSTISYQMIPYDFDVHSVNITATTSDPYASLVGTGHITLVDGIMVVEVYAVSDYGSVGQVYSIQLERKAAFSDTSLQDLVVYDHENNVLSFEEGPYNKNITGYTLKLASDATLTEIDIQALLVNSDKQTLEGHRGLQTLAIKEDGTINQTFSVTVTSESGDQQTYSITVLKGTNLSSDASINRVTLTDTDGNSYLSFNAFEALQDDVILDYNTSIINLNIIPNDQNATVVGNGTFTINPDQTATLKFKVIAQDGTTESLEYSINVHRQAPSSDNTLASLEVLNNGIDLLIDNNAFSSSKYTYTLKVDRSVEVLDIQAIANHSGAKITGDINQVLLVPGLQQLKIFVSAEDGSQRTYYINVEVVNTDIEIISLSVDSFDIGFDPLINQYDLGDISSSIETLNIKAIIPSSSYGTLSGDLGLVQLDYGLNIFTVTATSEDQSQTVTYQIFANRLEPDSNNYLSDLYVTDGEYRLPFSEAVFNKETNFYQIILDKTSKVESIEIFATAENGSIPSGTGRHLLTSVAGVIHNDFYVSVMAENGEENVYQIQVIKADSSDLSADTEIKDLTISTSDNDYEVLFDGDIIKQEAIMLDYKESSFFVDVIAGDRATIYGNTLYKLQPGETKTVEFYVEAENGDLSPTYSIQVTRPLPDANNTPDRLYVLVDGEIVELDVHENYHVIDIPDNIGSIGIEAEITDSQYIMGTGSKTITKDNQKFYVVVTAEDGTPNAYTIEVDQKSDNATLKSIMINGVEMFGHFKGNYLTLDEVLFETEILNVMATPSHSHSSVTGDGEILLEVGRNIIEIYATSELGTKGDVYTIEITRGQASSDASLSELIVKDNTSKEIIPYTSVFDPEVNKYTIALTMEDDIQEIFIQASANSAYIQSIEGQGVYTLKTASAETTEIFTVKVVAEDGSINRYEIHVTREVDPEDDVTIDRLSLFGESDNYLGTSERALNDFTMSQADYSISVPYHLSNLYLSITNLNGASIHGDGTHTLNDDVTVIEFYLTSKSGNVTGEKYTVTITKEPASSDHSLEGIYVDDALIEDFDPEVYLYEIEVSYEDVSSINVQAIANHPQANVIGDLGDVDLQAGTNTINIRVVAEDGSLVTYKLLVSRLSTDADLDDLFVYDHDLNYTFDQGRIRYELTVPYTTEFVEIGAVANPLASIMNTGIKYLEVGMNTYEVYAISESGLKGTVYEVHITREEVSSDSSLKSLTIRDAVSNDIIQYGPEFKPGTTDYVIILDDTSSVNSLMIEGIANDEFASVGGNGYKVLKAKVDGNYHNIFEVTVRAQDLSTTTYTISVYKDVDLSNSTQMNDLSLTASNGQVYLGTENAQMQFSPNIYYYEITVPYNVNSMTLSIDTETATAYGIGTKIFVDNTIQFEAYVVSQSGQNYTDEYIILVHREEAVVENQLKNIYVNGDKIDGFDPEQSYYEIDIPYLSTDKVIISGEALDASSRITGDIGTHDLEEGKNVYQINVTAQNGEVNSYTVAINYLNANAYLEDLQVINPETEKSYPFTFNPETFEYTINVGKSDAEVILAGRAQDQNSAAIIGLGRYEINEYGNTAVINVIASDNKTTLSYTVNIVREELPSNNSKLKSLSVGGQNLAFNPDTLQYELTVNDSINDLDVFAETECPDAILSISGQDDISVGKNVVLIEVQAEDGTQSIYQLMVHKDAQPDNFLTMLLIISLLVWIITVLVILIKSQRERRHYKKSIIK
ncbi:cadherin-like beta sandwich domain-containing protein [Mycoplasmatota bacterium]|nr:cadherin-like beta sandwich domain-containing protein [Mycoplasmatota bacterium]